MEITDFSNDFLDDIIEIERKSFKKPWTKEMFLSSAANGKTKLKLSLENGKVTGFCIYMTVEDETEILDIAVDPDFRRRCVAGNILRYVQADAENDGSRAIFLEVRESNAAAISLYLSFGFNKIGIRKKYYTDEDAIVLRKTI